MSTIRSPGQRPYPTEQCIIAPVGSQPQLHAWIPFVRPATTNLPEYQYLVGTTTEMSRYEIPKSCWQSGLVFWFRRVSHLISMAGLFLDQGGLFFRWMSVWRMCTVHIHAARCNMNWSLPGMSKVISTIPQCADHNHFVSVPAAFACSSDIDECLLGLADCHYNAECINLPGSFNCECKGGYSGNGTACICMFPKIPEQLSLNPQECLSSLYLANVQLLEPGFMRIVC